MRDFAACDHCTEELLTYLAVRVCVDRSGFDEAWLQAYPPRGER